MRRLTQAQGILAFYLFDLLLLLLLALSFLPFMRKRQPRVQETALLNPALKGDVVFVELSRKEGGAFLSRSSVSLFRQGGLWLGSSSEGNGEFVWPADAQAVEKLLDLSSAIVRAYEKAMSRRDWGDFGLREDEAFCLSFYDSSRRPLSAVYFGKEDSLTGRISVRSASDDAVYELDAGIRPYLTLDESFWADPFLYPQALTGLGRGEADLMLRRGRIENIRPRDGLEVDYRCKMHFGNGAEISFAIYRKESAYIVIPALACGPAASDGERSAIASVNYRYSISGVTLDSLLAECAQAQ